MSVECSLWVWLGEGSFHYLGLSFQPGESHSREPLVSGTKLFLLLPKMASQVKLPGIESTEMWPEAALLLLVNLRMLSRLLASGVALRVASLSLCGWLSYFFVGLLKTEPVAEEGEDAVTMLSAPEALTEEEQEELRRELTKVEEEIQTLSQVLAAKEKHLAELKRKLGISSLQEFKQNIAKGWQDVTATNAYKKTSETLSQAGQKASAAFSSVGSVITKKLEDVKLQAFSHSFSIRSIQHSISMPAMRNSPTFKSFEEKVENLKSKVGGAKPAGGDFGEVLNSTANATSTMTTEPPPEQMTESP
ncbi:tumor protein D52 isoform 7 [Mus musculus]|uniref:tumor protein D52 isoform 7 n=1 Tax=Mus musculus TaxID=10090 RepID=UPI0003D76187|nr:tumor protein D52 isoform 7 [Mus musculus]|eukprot:XP_006530123.3 PREDICTED: tumor protein D52 isoform X7 [Mus musculus]